MRFFDFNLSQPHKHRLTLISVLNAPHCKVLESGPCFSFFFLPSASLLSSPSLSLCNLLPVVCHVKKTEARQVNGSAQVGGCVCVRDYRNVHEPASPPHFVSFDNILKEVNNTRA